MTSPVVCLVQARMGSRRFPGKMMADLCGHPVLHWVLTRLARARRIDRLILATTRESDDDALVALARDHGVDIHRGSTDDVLDRFAAAARTVGAETVVRVCADNPLVAPEVVDAAIEAFADSRPDYAFNHVPRLGLDIVDGLGAEVLDAGLLANLADRATEPMEREHVTKFIWDRADEFRILAVTCRSDWRADGRPIRLDVDRPADLEFLRHLCRGMTPEVSAADVVAAWKALAPDRTQEAS
jgi:spore coat polysaccharide biosynthesis protein SpsF